MTSAPRSASNLVQNGAATKWPISRTRSPESTGAACADRVIYLMPHLFLGHDRKRGGRSSGHRNLRHRERHMICHGIDRCSARETRTEEQTSELQALMRLSYAVV